MGRLTNGNGGDPGDSIHRSVEDLMSRIPAGLLRAALILEAETKQILLTPGRGRMYGKHRASAPGDPPAPDTGTLQRSITHEAVSETVMRVGSNIEYAPMLEFGTLPRGRDSARAGRGTLGRSLGGIAPRPFMRPAFTRAAPNMTVEMAAELRRGDR